MIGIKSPDSITGLTLWWDASDINTVNNGRVTDTENVFKIVDKVSGVALTNPNGVLGPSYSFGAINGKNAIHFPYYSNTNGAQKALVGSNVTQLNTPQTKTIVFVFKPTTLTEPGSPAGTNTKYSFAIWGLGRNFGTSPDIALFCGSGINPYPQYVESVNPWNTGPSRTISIWNSKSYEFGNKNSSSVDLGVVQTFIGRTKLSFNQTSWLQSGGLDSKYNFYNDGTKYTGTPVSPSTPSRIVIGGYFDSTYSKFSRAYPMEGYFCEMLYYNRYLTNAEINGLEIYMKRKWIG